MIPNLATLILMGGQNKRMNGQHKAFLKLHEKSFLDQIITSLKSCGPIYLSVNDKSLYSHLPYPLIEDCYKEIGPIGGTYSTLLKVPSDFLLSSPATCLLWRLSLLTTFIVSLNLIPPALLYQTLAGASTHLVAFILKPCSLLLKSRLKRKTTALVLSLNVQALKSFH